MTYEQIKNQLPANVEQWHYERVKLAYARCLFLPSVEIDNEHIYFLDKFGTGFKCSKEGIISQAEALKKANLPRRN